VTFIRIVHYIPAAQVISTMAARAPFMVMLAPACLPRALHHAYRPKVRVQIEMPTPTEAELTHYLRSKGWAWTGGEWRSPDGASALPSYPRRLSAFIASIANYEGRPGAEVVNDILTPRRHMRNLPISAGADADGMPVIISDGKPMSEEAFNALVSEELPLALAEDHSAMLDGLVALGFRHAKPLDGPRMLAASLPLGIQVQWVPSESEFVALDVPGRNFGLRPEQARDLAHRLLLAAELAEASPEQKAEVVARRGMAAS
jgi:hypothetical protein